MKTLKHSIVILLALAVVAPGFTFARESSEPSESPRASNTPKVSASAKPVESSAGDVNDEERELDNIEKDLDEAENAVETPEIQVPEELRAKARKLADEDGNVADVHVSAEDKSVEVKYRLRAKLFGLIDVPYELEAKVDAKEGTIKAKGPWWLLFARDNASDVQAALDADKTLLTQTNQGKILSSIISILKSIADR